MRIKKLGITIISICCGMLLFAACKEDRAVESISLNDYSAETPLEISMGALSYKDYTVTITYDDGETEEVTLTEEMISETDKLKFYQEGESEITITHKGVSTSVAIKVVRNEFAESVQLNGVTTTYTGEAFTVEVEGEIPGGTKILYPQGNVFQNAGTYDMTAILQCDGYVTKTLSAKVVIGKATYDVSNAQLYDATFVYDKEAHGIAVKGQPFEENGATMYAPTELPEGVSVSYTIIKTCDSNGTEIPTNKQQVVEGNKAIDAGTYKVCAQFKGDAGNYEAIPDAFAYLTIKRANYDLSKVKFDDKTVTYSGKAYPFAIAEDSKMPLDVEVSYQIQRLEDGEGNAVTEDPTDYDPTKTSGAHPTDAGKYLVQAAFTITGKNAANYIANPLQKEAYLTIERATYDTSDMGFADAIYQYTGEAYKVFIEEDKLPEGVEVSYQIKCVKDGAGNEVAGEYADYKPTAEGEADDGFKPTDAGTYEIKAIFSMQDAYKNNYKVSLVEKTVNLIILRSEIDMSAVQLESGVVQYSGNAYELKIEGELPTGVEVSYQIKRVKDGEGNNVTEEYQDGCEATEVGVYLIKATFQLSDEQANNYTLSIVEKEAELTITSEI